MKTKILLFFLLITSICYSQIQPLDHTGPDADNLKEAAIKINANFEYVDSAAVVNQGSSISHDYADNVSAIKSNIDIVGPGTITLTNGSATVTGTGTNFTDATAGKGLSYWFSFHVTDAAGTNYYIFLSSITNATTATISYVFTEDALFTAGAVATTTFPGTSGSYTYKIVRNRAKGIFSNSLGNNSLTRDFGTAFGGLTTAAGTTSFAIGAQTLATGSRAFAGGWGSFSSNLDKRVLAAGQASFNWSQNFSTQTIGHGALALGSAILGGRDHNIPSDATNSAIIGGNLIKVGAGIQNTVHLPKVRLGLGTGGTMVTDNTNTNILARDATTGEIEIRDASTLGGGWNTDVVQTFSTSQEKRFSGATTFTLGTDNLSGFFMGKEAVTNKEWTQLVGMAAAPSSEGVAISLDVANSQGLGDGARFVDLRAVPKGLQYPIGTTYETTGDNQTLISKGFANLNYWKTSGTTNITSSSIIDIPAFSDNGVTINAGDIAGAQGLQSYIIADGFDGGRYFLRSTGSLSTRFGGIQATLGSAQIEASSVNGNFLLIFNGETELATFNDNRNSKRGLEYAATGYVTQLHSVTDKEYVDNRTLEGSALLDFPSVTGPNTSDLTITVTGAAVGDPVSLGIPPTAMTGGATPTIYLAFVSAVNTVTIRLICPVTGPAVNPASATFKVVVHKP